MWLKVKVADAEVGFIKYAPKHMILSRGAQGTAEHLHLDNDGVADWIKSPQERTRVFVEQHAEEAVRESKTPLNNGKGTKCAI
jgi:hypothetical protein